MALGAPVPWYGSGVATFIHRHSSESPYPNGFILAKKRLGRPEAEVRYIAPALDAGPNVDGAWRALLEHLVAHAGDFGIQRLQVCIPTREDAAALLAQCGFALYTRESLFRLRSRPRHLSPAAAAPYVRAQREADSFALQRLADRFIPPVVSRAEGVSFHNGTVNHALIFQNWWQPEQQDSLVFERQGDIQAALIMQRGPRGIWLRFLGDPSLQEAMDALLYQGLLALPHDRPIYCGVRAYQAALGPVLHAREFETITELARFVKYTTVSVREPAPAHSRPLVETTFPGVIPSKIERR